MSVSSIYSTSNEFIWDRTASRDRGVLVVASVVDGVVVSAPAAGSVTVPVSAPVAGVVGSDINYI